jgi:putative spermidine/putrescine transport system permease protein
MNRSVTFQAVVYLIFAMIMLPMLVVVAVSFNPTAAFTVDFGGASLRWYRAFFTSETFFKALFLVSLPIAIISSIVATLAGALSAIAIVRFRFPGKEFLEAAFMLPLLIPSILLGAALYLLFTRLHAGGSYVSLVIGHVLLGVPYVIRVVSAGLAGISLSLEEAAISLGCDRIGAFRRVTLPLLRSSLFSGAIFAFMVSFGDINLALFVAGPNTTTMPLEIFSEIVWQGDPTVAAASTIQILLVSTLVLVAQRVFRIRLAF